MKMRIRIAIEGTSSTTPSPSPIQELRMQKENIILVGYDQVLIGNCSILPNST